MKESIIICAVVLCVVLLCSTALADSYPFDLPLLHSGTVMGIGRVTTDRSSTQTAKLMEEGFGAYAKGRQAAVLSTPEMETVR